MLRKFLYLIPVLIIVSCSRDEFPPTADLTLEFTYSVDGQPLVFDTVWYRNAAGNLYTVNHLEYFISALTLISCQGDSIVLSAFHYIDAKKPFYRTLQFKTLPVGKYQSILLQVGLSPEQNISYFLPPTTEHHNMSWPGMMGGGYHFLKLEGHCMHQLQPQGYAVHLGNNAHLVQCTFHGNFEILDGQQSLSIQMNINEWFDNPVKYDLLLDGNYTMGDSLLMSKIALNGQDVFSLKH